jgi:rhodanese-related sulfurtransferase
MMETISAGELDWYAREGRIPIIDLRSRDEFARDHVSGAINVPQGSFHGELEGRQGTEVILYCERGALSMAVARELEAQGYRTKTVVGGFRAYKRMEIW